MEGIKAITRTAFAVKTGGVNEWPKKCFLGSSHDYSHTWDRLNQMVTGTKAIPNQTQMRLESSQINWLSCRIAQHFLGKQITNVRKTLSSYLWAVFSWIK